MNLEKNVFTRTLALPLFSPGNPNAQTNSQQASLVQLHKACAQATCKAAAA
jgi:hypothetical protein